MKFWHVVLAMLCCFAGHAAVPKTQQPDILILMPDQMRGDCLSLLGHSAVRTPHLDSLARQGTLFRRAYATCPSCIPSRFSLLTGLFPSTSGVVGYAATPIRHPTLPQLLGEAGYRTVLVGRYMHQVPVEESYGFQEEIRGSTYINDDEYDNYLKRVAPETGGIHALVKKMGLTYNGWQAGPWQLDESLHPTVWIVAQAQKVLKEAAIEKPLFLTVSFYAPHPPLFPPRRYFDSFKDDQLPPAAHGDWEDWNALSPEGNKSGDRVLLQGETLRATQRGYFGAVEQLDDKMAEVMDAFKARAEQEHRPWVILLTSDHGEMLGDHGYFRKCEPYEGSANVPYIIAGSAELHFKPGQRSDQPVCLEDVLPTLLALAGKPPTVKVDGVSLVPTLRGEKQTIRSLLHFEHAPCYNAQQAFQAITDGHYKYIWRPLDGREQLFDLDKDLHEDHDLTKQKDERTAVERWRNRLIQVLEDRPEKFTDGTNLISGRPYPALQAKAKLANSPDNTPHRK